MAAILSGMRCVNYLGAITLTNDAQVEQTYKSHEFQWNFNQNKTIFKHENMIRNVVWKLVTILCRIEVKCYTDPAWLSVTNERKIVD